MGRFSKLETGQRGDAPAPVPPTPQNIETGGSYPFSAEPSAAEMANLDAAGWARLADEAFFRGDNKNALRWYSRAMDRDSTLQQPWVAMIRTLLLKGDLNEAQTWITRGLTVFPESPALLSLRAVQYARKGLVHQGLNNSDAVLEKNGADAQAHIARGEVLTLADSKNANFCFDQALNLTGASDWRTPMYIALFLEERRQWAKAIKYYVKAAERSESVAVVWYRVGLCRAELGQREMALKAYERARELCPPEDPLLARIEAASPGSAWKKIGRLFGRK